MNMIKSLNLIAEIVRNTKHPFPQADRRPAKTGKNRYERRKIREFLHLGDWTGEADVSQEKFARRVRAPRAGTVPSSVR
jgi:hypothetical protein